MNAAEELVEVARQRTWNKELVLWLGPEAPLRAALATVQVVVLDLDLLDLFDPDRLPIDDESVRQQIVSALEARLRSIPRKAGKRTALVVRSAGLLAKYRVGTNEFYDWFCDDFSMAILLVEGTYADLARAEGVVCDPDRLTNYFAEPDMVTRRLRL